MRTIHKFQLEMADQQVVVMPTGADIIAVDKQRGHEGLMVWAIVDTEGTETEERSFAIHGTGHPIVDDASGGTHIGTVLAENGALVWHVFDTTTVPF